MTNKNAITNVVNTNRLTFGFEFECFVPSDKVTRAKSFAASKNWSAVRDGSISPDNGYVGVEFVSPILNGLAGLTNVEEVLTSLVDVYGAKVNSSCGAHVHVGTPERVTGNDTKEYYSRLVRIVSQQEDALFGIGGDNRRIDNGYCASLRSCYSSNSAPKKGDSDRDFNNKTVNSSRYRVLNLNHINNSHPRVEFRVFAGTTNVTAMIGYIVTALGLVHLARVQGNVMKFNETWATDFRASVKKLHNKLNWNGYRTTMNFKLGWPTEAFERYGRKVMKAQRVEAKRLQATMDSHRNRA